MSPSEALIAAAQIAVALAGFAGIAAAFGKGALHTWSASDVLRLRLLLTTGLLPLAWCLGALLLLSTNLRADLIWRTCSVVSAVMLVSGLAPSGRRVSALTPSHDVNRNLFFATGVLGLAVALLQIYNALALGAFWPFYCMVVTSMLVCMLQFARLILRQASAE